jgi:hypothetical protein
MKLLVMIMMILSSQMVLSATVKVTSFNYVRLQANDPFSPLAELCGQVESMSATPTFIKILVDPKANKPASYNTFADEKGKFCMAVVTYRGSAEVSIIGDSQKELAQIK